MKKKDNSNFSLYICIIIFVFFTTCVFFVFFFSGDKETHVSEDSVYPNTFALVCEAGAIEDAYFHGEDAESESNKIKVLFEEERPKQLFYSYLGEYGSEKIADSRKIEFHSKYNHFLGEHTMSQNRMMTTFSQIDNNVRIDVYTDVDELTRDSSAFFFINDDEVNNYLNYKSDEMKKIYENKGFSCIINS